MVKQNPPITNYHNIVYCPHSGKEDCLYVYIYVPREQLKETDELLDVVIHIHGGAFMIGSPSIMAGPDYITDRDVVYVSLNYRLGLLGTTVNCFKDGYAEIVS